ncbi:MAG: endonuclease/exonuclease/phosphatase family protein [Bacteroidales bacterium]|nr:endonuclease/exonuclease/phosphatase family protein [Bacteroidales bacterium]
MSFSQDAKEYEIVTVAFYNVENLYDTINQPEVLEYEFNPESKKRWNTERYYRKIERLSTTIIQIGDEKTNDAPAVVGLCEVENRDVLEDLVNSEAMKPYGYKIIHYDSWYLRGVDVALLYRPDYFKPTNSVPHRIYFKNSDFQSRDHLLVSGELLGEEIHFVVMHWPSRRGGEKRSRPLRIEAAELCLEIADSIRKIDDDAKLVFFGDFNDDPFNVSVAKTLNASSDPDIITPTRLYNPMYGLFKKGIGSLAWRDSWNLFDQFVISTSLLDKDSKSLIFYSAHVFNKPFLAQKEGRFKGYPWRSYVGNTYMDGYSDHFPSFIYLIKEKSN